jgi:hypothetical protein
MDFYGKKFEVFKANLHTHSTHSDGEYSPEQVIRFYARAGYDGLAFTDHRKANPVGGYDGGGMTLLSGIELHPPGPRGILWHLLALGVPEDFPGLYDCAEDAIGAVRQAGGIVFAAHPYWCGFTAAEVGSLAGISGIEVYNTSTRYVGKEYNMQIWDDLLDAGGSHTALAVDDTHKLRDLFKGWTMICAESKSPEALLAALRDGRFYATQGPEFSRLGLKDRIFEAEFSGVRSAIVVSNRNRGFNCGVEDDPMPGPEQKTITSLRVDLSALPPGSYIRCQLKDAQGRMAWSNPLRID